MTMKCDICDAETKGMEFANLALKHTVLSLNYPTYYTNQCEWNYKICEGCFMSFEYWKDSRKNKEGNR